MTGFLLLLTCRVDEFRDDRWGSLYARLLVIVTMWTPHEIRQLVHLQHLAGCAEDGRPSGRVTSCLVRRRVLSPPAAGDRLLTACWPPSRRLRRLAERRHVIRIGTASDTRELIMIVFFTYVHYRDLMSRFSSLHRGRERFDSPQARRIEMLWAVALSIFLHFSSGNGGNGVFWSKNCHSVRAVYF